MAKIMARISAGGRVELIDDRSANLESAEPMTPLDAAYLARGMLSCAAVLSGENPPKVGTIGGDTYLPTLKCAVGSSAATDVLVLKLFVPPGIELSFQMTSQVARALGETLLAQGGGVSEPPASHGGTVH
jgi:hypothetical protein